MVTSTSQAHQPVPEVGRNLMGTLRGDGESVQMGRPTSCWPPHCRAGFLGALVSPQGLFRTQLGRKHTWSPGPARPQPAGPGAWFS